MNEQTEKQNIESTPDLKLCVFSRIKDEGITPKQKWRFLCEESGIWTLFLLALLIGSGAVAATIFSQLHVGWEYYEATHDNTLTFLVETLPHLWLLVLGGMVWFGYYQLRHTKKGYRYPLWGIVVVSIAGSVVGGVVLHSFGYGHVVDHKLGKYIPTHKSALFMQEALWQNPAEGRLYGTLSFGTTTYTLTDKENKTWQLVVGTASPHDQTLLRVGESVRVLGYASSSDDSYFHICHVVPAPPEEEQSFTEFRERRDQYRSRMLKEDDDGRLSTACAKLMEAKRPEAPKPLPKERPPVPKLD